MSQTRARIGKQMQLSTTPQSVVATDLSNEQQYIAPGANGTFVGMSGGVLGFYTPPASDNWIFGTSNPTAGFGIGGIIYLGIAGMMIGLEASVHTHLPAVEITQFGFRFGTNSYDNTVTVTLFQNGVTTGNSVVIPAGSTTETLSAVFSVIGVDGDTYSFEIDKTAPTSGAATLGGTRTKVAY